MGAPKKADWRAALLPERSVETSTAWFKKHPEVDIVSRDRGKIFREAASCGVPQARQIADRFHLQQNFAAALQDFFRHHEQVLKTVAKPLAGTVPAPPKAPAAKQIQRERRRRHAKRVALHKKIWKLFRAGRRKEEIARIVGVSSRSVSRTLEHEQPPAKDAKES
jgi:transposase